MSTRLLNIVQDRVVHFDYGINLCNKYGVSHIPLIPYDSSTAAYAHCFLEFQRIESDQYADETQADILCRDKAENILGIVFDQALGFWGSAILAYIARCNSARKNYSNVYRGSLGISISRHFAKSPNHFARRITQIKSQYTAIKKGVPSKSIILEYDWGLTFNKFMNIINDLDSLSSDLTEEWKLIATEASATVQSFRNWLALVAAIAGAFGSGAVLSNYIIGNSQNNKAMPCLSTPSPTHSSGR